MRRPSLGLNPRRGLTLLEMLVVVALVVLIMTILVAIFQAATGAMIASRAYQELNEDLRRLETTLRQDLNGATASFTPPLNPADNKGYFEYGENARADVQGEDADDYIAFTAQAPEGQPFTGRMWLVGSLTNAAQLATQPIQVTSQFAEIIYFLRDGNLYRRVLLIKPELNGTNQLSPTFFSALTTLGFTSQAGWYAANDISVHPSKSNDATVPPVANTLGDLTNRQNRFARARFTPDFRLSDGSAGTDGTPDDFNAGGGNGIPDYYPTLYPNAFSVTIPHTYVTPTGTNTVNEPLIFDFAHTRAPFSSNADLTTDVLAFPYVFPGAYSKNYSQLFATATTTANRFHAPLGTYSTRTGAGTAYYINHNPLAGGLDNYFTPDIGKSNEFQTWWGFPTWRETATVAWNDPIYSSFQLTTSQARGLSWANRTTQHLPWGNTASPFSDGDPTAQGPFAGALSQGWDDDLIMTNVRSFDVKALDSSYVPFNTPLAQTAYVDLGYLNIDGTNPEGNAALGTPNPTVPPISVQLKGFGHEGRIPPLESDFRVDAQAPQDFNGVPYRLYDNSTDIIRLQRVFDTWSTDYTQAPASPPTQLVIPGYQRPFYPSFPPPYPAALRGIQIQIRVADPRGERLRILTIRQDFSDKL